jgi:hypothetical protein
MEENPFEVIDGVPGSEVAKQRFKVMLSYWQGNFTEAEACRLLEVDQEGFADLQRTALQAMTDAIAKEELDHRNGKDGRQ